MVHATVDEPPELLAAFCAHYIGLGASEVHLFLDRPQPDIIRMLQGKPKIRLTICDDSYWAKTRSGTRPPYHVERQLYNANSAYRQARTGWFLFCDADEFLFPTKPISGLLASVSRTLNFVRVPVTERFYEKRNGSQDIFSGLFRDPLIGRSALVKEIYKHSAKFLDYGVVGHSIGKSFTRVGCLLKIGLHFPHVPKRKGSNVTYSTLMKQPEYAHFLDNVLLAHFVSVTEFEYCLRLLRKYVSLQLKSGAGNPVVFPNLPRKRIEAMKTVYQFRSDTGALRQFLSSVSPDRTTIEHLARVGACRSLSTDNLAKAAREMFPDAQLDFSVRTADARLREDFADLIHDTGFAL